MSTWATVVEMGRTASSPICDKSRSSFLGLGKQPGAPFPPLIQRKPAKEEKQQRRPPFFCNCGFAFSKTRLFGGDVGWRAWKFGLAWRFTRLDLTSWLGLAALVFASFLHQKQVLSLLWVWDLETFGSDPLHLTHTINFSGIGLNNFATFRRLAPSTLRVWPCKKLVFLLWTKEKKGKGNVMFERNFEWTLDDSLWFRLTEWFK